MKKSLILAFCLAGISSFASTVNWGIDTKSYFETSSLGGNCMGYLVYLGEAGTTWATTKTDYISIATGSSDEYTSSKKSSVGKVSGEASISVGDSVFTGSSTKVVDGNSVFGTMLVYTKDETTYYFLGSINTFDTTSSSYEAVPSDMFSWRSSGPASNSDHTAQGWTAVPEPSTAALALAGLALLLKRRKA